MPNITKNSLTLSAACRRHPNEDAEMVEKRLRYGRIPAYTTQEHDFVGFTSQLDRVEPLDGPLPFRRKSYVRDFSSTVGSGDGYELVEVFLKN